MRTLRLLGLTLLMMPLLVTAQDTLHIFPTEGTAESLEQWDTVVFDDIEPAHYELAEMDGQTVVHGKSKGQASSIGQPVEIDLNEYPILEWRWRVDKLPKKGDARIKNGDDYGARIYITFQYQNWQGSFWERTKYKTVKNLFGVDNLPFRSINYIWANKVEQGEFLPNPFTDWVMMIAAESGTEYLGEWRFYRRNVLEDYKTAFGEDPSLINGVIFMTDSDNTKGESEAYWGEIRFVKEGK